MSWKKKTPDKAVLIFGDTNIDFEKDDPTITGNTVIESPLYKAGLDKGDVLLRLDGKPLNNARTFQRIMAAHAPGDSVSITYQSLEKTRKGTIVLAEDETLRLVPFEKTDKKLTSEIKSFRNEWLGSKAGF